MTRPTTAIFSREIVLAAIGASFGKLDPRTLFRNPVIFIVEIGSVITTAIFIGDLFSSNDAVSSTNPQPLWFTGVVAFWLWLTVLFANFAEAIAEGRGKAQAQALRATRTTTVAFRRIGLGASRYAARDLWAHRSRPPSAGLTIVVPPTSAALFRLRRAVTSRTPSRGTRGSP